MFSTSQLDMSQSLIATYFEQGYEYYICHTNTNLSNNNYNNYDYYDLTFYFSKSPITFSNNKFTCEGEFIKINALSRNVSNNISDSRLSRLSVTNSSNLNVSIPLYEHIMSNADNSYFMNTLAYVEYNNTNNLSYNLSVEDFFIPCVLICILILNYWLKEWFAKNYHKEKEV